MKLYAWRGIYFRRDIIEYQGNTIDYHQQTLGFVLLIQSHVIYHRRFEYSYWQ